MKILHKPKKSLGQNFLIDNNVINKIINIYDIEKKTILEIGPGYGSLTKKILEMNPIKLFAIEKDKKLFNFLTNEFDNFNNIKFINDDIINVIKNKKLEKNIVVFGNLPYNISTKILTSLMLLDNWPPWYDVLILMFQKEVADRITARTHTKEFSRLTVLANWRLEIKKHFVISKNCFFPKPKINSTLLSFKPKKNNLINLQNSQNLEKVTRILFSNRRKMINKNFKKLFKDKLHLTKNLDIDLNKRPEELSNETYYKIAAEYEKLFC